MTHATEDVSRRLLASAAALSYDPATEIDWDAPTGDELYGINPQWSTLYGTPLWAAMSEAQRVTLTRHEVCSIMSTGIWFEMILQQMILRDQYAKDPASSEFQFALTEIADECRHSIMFARVCQTLGVTGYGPRRPAVELGRLFKTLAPAEVAYGGALVAEEVLDVMQRDWMRGDDVLPIVRASSRIHVLEESRHMKFARQEMRESLANATKIRKLASSIAVAAGAFVIVRSMVHPAVYAAAGLDTAEALAQAKHNQHYQTMLRSSCAHLMDFLADVGLLTQPASALYQRVHML